MIFSRYTLFFGLLVLFFTISSCQKEPVTVQNMSLDELNVLADSLLLVEAKLTGQIHNTIQIKSAVVQSYEGLFQTLQGAGVSRTQSLKIINAISDSVEFSNLKVGQMFHVGYRPNDSVNVAVFRFAETPARVHLLFSDSAGAEFRYARVEKPVTIKQSIYDGVIEQGSSLHVNLHKTGISSRMIGIVTGVLMCKVNFNRDVHAGDKFKLMLEETFFQDSIWIEGKVLYASFDGRIAKHHEAFRYQDPDPKSTFNAHYTEKGEALVYSGLRYPLDRLHITSPFGWRIHPITGKKAFHNGVDYGSPRGSPVYAVADGRVTVSGYDQYSGNKIAIKHADNSSSWYLHLHVRGVRAGQQIKSRQVIGRVGNTGRSTGPHLHLGFMQNGKWLNPLQKRMIATPKLEGEKALRLQEQITTIRQAMTLLENTPAVKASDSTGSMVKMRVVSAAN